MAIHAATHHDVSVVAITLSREQAKLAARRIEDAGLRGRVDVRLCDYRDVAALRLGPFDAISSVGMAEHVGASAFAEYAAQLYAVLADGGRLLNHQISKPSGGPRRSGPSFIDRYIFPDGELLPVGHVAEVLEGAGFEIRDVEGLRENYVLTLLAWLDNLRRHRDEATRLVGVERVRTWELYLAGCAAAFTAGRIGIHQTLAVKAPSGTSGLPRIREQWLCG
jgi:cyclopropane-fatty-acyl-phospholipid synthase